MCITHIYINIIIGNFSAKNITIISYKEKVLLKHTVKILFLKYSIFL